MPDGSPIDQWWKSHRPPRSAPASTRVCAADRYGLAYCRTKRNAGVSTNRAQVTCGDCLAAIAADESKTEDHQNGSKPEHGPDWSDWGIDHPEEGPSCRCGFNGTPEECQATGSSEREPA